MTRFLADENFNLNAVQELRRHLPSLDIIRVQELGMTQAIDPSILERAAEMGRVVLTHDVKTMPGFAYDRVRASLPMPGVVIVPDLLPVGKTVEDLELMITCSLDDEWADRVQYLPLR